jgi:hypothetical protein
MFDITVPALAFAIVALVTMALPGGWLSLSTRKVGGIWFFRCARLQLSFCVVRRKAGRGA